MVVTGRLRRTPYPSAGMEEEWVCCVVPRHGWCRSKSLVLLFKLCLCCRCRYGETSAAAAGGSECLGKNCRPVIRKGIWPRRTLLAE